MIEVVSIKFKNRGKSYYFDPCGVEMKAGEKVIVETSKGLEIADCFRAAHAVEETAVVQPLRPVIRIATEDDLRVEAINKKCEKEAFTICEQKIQEHGLDMKLVDVECSFDGSKTTFFFTSDGRVDFRELVKDLAGIFRNRIELRQIGVRDEAKMLGGLGICGRPYCCHQFLDDFQPVSTKMAKVQSLSLNPTKISGSCGRLMCCLRYEQDAYEDLIKRVPKQGAFVETKDGYGTAVQINLLRQTVKVKLDKDSDDSIHLYKANELATVPGGRPKDGEDPLKVYVPVPEEADEPEIVFTPVQEIMQTEEIFLEEKEEAEAIEAPVEKKVAPYTEKHHKSVKKTNKPGSHVKVEKKPAAKQSDEEAVLTEEISELKARNNEKKFNNRNRNHKKQHKGPKPGAEKTDGETVKNAASEKQPMQQKPVKKNPKKEHKPEEVKSTDSNAEGSEVPAKKKHYSGKKFYHHKKPHKPANAE